MRAMSYNQRNSGKVFIMKLSSPFVVVLCGLMLLTLPAASAGAQDHPWMVRAGVQVSPFAFGNAGAGPGGPEYGDAFAAGVGGVLEVALRLDERFSLLAGGGYDVFGGCSHEGVDFDDLETAYGYIGGKLHIIPVETSWDPYLRVAAGGVRMSAVDIDYMGMTGEYWEASWQMLLDFGFGLAYRWQRLEFYLELTLRHLGEPDAALGSASEADTAWTLPVKFGIGFSF